jgi:periplasmic protein TonB
MEPKKNPHLDFSKDRNVLRALGFAAILMACYMMFSFTVFEKKKSKVSVALVTDDAEVIENTTHEKAPPPPPPPLTLQVVENTVEETNNFQDNEFKDDEPVEEAPEPTKEQPKEEVEDNEIYENIANKPSFKGGDSKLQDFISENLVYPPAAYDNEIEGVILVIFVINKDGSVSDVTTDGKGNKDLQKAAIEVVKKTSSMWKPGSQREKPVKVRAKIPITFSIDE